MYTRHPFLLPLALSLPQTQLKESNLNADEAARAKGEQAIRLRDLEKKIRTLEQDLNQVQEVSRQYELSISV